MAWTKAMAAMAVGSVLFGAAGCSCGSETVGEAGAAGSGANAGATSGAGGAVACIAGLAAIELSPADSMVTLDGGAAAPIAFQATGVLDDGTEAPLDAAALDWSVSRDDDTNPGTITEGTLEPYPSAGGVVTVEATDGCVAGIL